LEIKKYDDECNKILNNIEEIEKKLNGEKIENGNLIYFNKETGEFFLYYKVNPELGLPLDDKGQVVVGDFNTKEDSKIERCGFY